MKTYCHFLIPPSKPVRWWNAIERFKCWRSHREFMRVLLHSLMQPIETSSNVGGCIIFPRLDLEAERQRLIDDGYDGPTFIEDTDGHQP